MYFPITYSYRLDDETKIDLKTSVESFYIKFLFHLINMSNRIYFEFPELAQQKLLYGIILFDTYIFLFGTD